MSGSRQRRRARREAELAAKARDAEQTRLAFARATAWAARREFVPYMFPVEKADALEVCLEEQEVA